MAARTYRVLHLLCSPEMRGAELFGIKLAEALQGELFENALCSLYFSPFSADNVLHTRLPQFNLAGHPTRWQAIAGLDPQTVYRLRGVMRRFQPDVVIAHGGKSLKFAGIVKLLCRKPKVVYKNIGTASVWAKSSLGIALNKVLLRGIDTVVSVSEYTRQDFMGLYGLPPERVVCIPSGVGDEEFHNPALRAARAEVRDGLGLSDSATVLISVGSLSPEKGHHDLLQVMAELRDLEPAAHLVLVGDGPVRQELEDEAKGLGVTSHVHMVGMRTDVARYLAAADLFLLPSRTEGMPSAVIEAGLSGLPTVAYDVGGVGEAVKEDLTGRLVAPGDTQRFFEGVLDMCRHPQKRIALGQAARELCLAKFELSKIASQYQELLLGLLEPGTAARSMEHTVH